MDLRTRRREQQREQVVAIAFELFHEQGYDATTVEAIADAAGISPRTFYRYFDAKDGVLAELGSAMVGEVLARVASRDGDVSLTTLVRLLTEVGEESLADRRGDLLFRLLRERPELRERAGRWREQWGDEFAVGLAARAGRDEPTLEDAVLGRATIGIFAVALDHWVKGPGDEGSIAANVEETLRVLRHRLDVGERSA